MRIALGQLNSQGNWEKNLASILTQVTVARMKEAAAIFFPENALFMGDPNQARRMAPAIQKHALPKIRAAAADFKIAVLIGSYPEPRPSLRKISNTSVFIDEHGVELARYRKIHLFDVRTPEGKLYRESKTIAAGSSTTVFTWRRIRIGMSVCFDVRFPEMYRSLSAHGAEWLLVPSAFTHETGKEHWHTLLKARAIENLAYVFAPAQTGRHPMGRRTFGHSLAVGPWGDVLGDGGTDAGITLVEVALGDVKRLRAKFGSALSAR